MLGAPKWPPCPRLTLLATLPASLHFRLGGLPLRCPPSPSLKAPFPQPARCTAGPSPAHLLPKP